MSKTISKTKDKISIHEPIAGIVVRKWMTDLTDNARSSIDVQLIHTEFNNGNIISGDFKVGKHGQLFIKDRRVINLLSLDISSDADYREYTLLGSDQIHSVMATRRYNVNLHITGQEFIFDNSKSKAFKIVKPKIIKQSRTGARLPSNAEMLKVIGR